MSQLKPFGFLNEIIENIEKYAGSAIKAGGYTGSHANSIDKLINYYDLYEKLLLYLNMYFLSIF